jgi:hypothetical protein
MDDNYLFKKPSLYEVNGVVIDLRCHIFIIKVQHYGVNQHLYSLFSNFSYKWNFV